MLGAGLLLRIVCFSELKAPEQHHLSNIEDSQ